MLKLSKQFALLLVFGCLLSCVPVSEGPSSVLVELSHGIDESAGGDPSYIVTTPSATYFLEKQGGGLSSMVDPDGVDWIGFHKEKGSGWKGEYRGFPNAIHKQDGNYFHAMNAGTDPSSAEITIEAEEHVQIVFMSDNGQWQGQWDFYPDRCQFTMSKVSEEYRYWVQYEGVPGGSMDETDYWYASGDDQKHPINESFIGDLPSPEWIAFGDQDSSRVIYLLHHEDDEHPDDYVSRPYMTVLGFGRRGKDKHLTTVQSFSIGFLETTQYSIINQEIGKVFESGQDN